jgi:hypothetical protein
MLGGDMQYNDIISLAVLFVGCALLYLEHKMLWKFSGLLHVSVHAILIFHQ